MSQAPKALQLLIDQVKAKDSIHSLSIKIAEDLSKCEKANENFENTTHLEDLYKYVKEQSSDDDGEFYSRSIVSEEQKISKLSKCPHCLSAHLAIQERKKAKKELGYLRMASTKMARKAIKEQGQC
jgi:hypothetical protein